MHFVMHAFNNHVEVLHQPIPLLWRGGGLMHFVMHAFNNHVEVLHNVHKYLVTPFVLLQQMAVLSDGVVASYLHQLIPLLWRGGGRSPTEWLHRYLHQPIPLLWRGGGRSPTGWL